MPSEMVARVANAIARSARAVGGGYVGSDDFPWEAAAQAAIEEMRGLTDAMQNAGWLQVPGYDPGYADVAKIWEAMIDAALVENPKP